MPLREVQAGCLSGARSTETAEASSVNVELTVPPELVEAVAERAAQIVLAKLGGATVSPWMTRAEAAEYLSVPVSRLEKRRDVPHVKDGARVLYHRDELDAWLLTQREGDWTFPS